MHDGLQLQRAGEVLLLLLMEPEREVSVCVGGQNVYQQLWVAVVCWLRKGRVSS